MLNTKFLSVLALTFLISGCTETPEEAEARHNRFKGQSVAQVSAAIGTPASVSQEQAVWNYRFTHSVRIPLQSYMNGRWVTHGYRTEYTDLHCVYTATLSQGRVDTSVFEGNGCHRLKPRRR